MLAKPSPSIKPNKVATPIGSAPSPPDPTSPASFSGSQQTQSPRTTVPGSLPSPSKNSEVGNKELEGNSRMLPSGDLGVTPNTDGSMGLQPTAAEPFEGLLWEDIPDLNDDLAPKPILGQSHLSPEAIRSRSRRVFTKRGDGTKKVSEEIWNDWHSKGPKKQLLEDIFKQCGYDADLWL